MIISFSLSFWADKLKECYLRIETYTTHQTGQIDWSRWWDKEKKSSLTAQTLLIHIILYKITCMKCIKEIKPLEANIYIFVYIYLYIYIKIYKLPSWNWSYFFVLFLILFLTRICNHVGCVIKRPFLNAKHNNLCHYLKGDTHSHMGVSSLKKSKWGGEGVDASQHPEVCVISKGVKWQVANFKKNNFFPYFTLSWSLTFFHSLFLIGDLLIGKQAWSCDVCSEA
jgi:hypothetical protein